MAKFDFKKLTDTVKQSADSFVKSAQENLPETMKNVNVAESMREMAQKSSEALAKFRKESENTDISARAALESIKPKLAVSTEDSLKIYYYFSAVDQQITQEEINKFIEIGHEIDPVFDEHRNQIIEFCDYELSKVIDEDDHYDTVHDCIGDCLRHSIETKANDINGKLLLWNLYVLSYSDGTSSKDEQRIIRYISKKMDIDKAVPLEMESTIKTLMAMEEEEVFLKNSNKKYTEVEVQLNELADRRNVIMQGIHALITD